MSIQRSASWCTGVAMVTLIHSGLISRATESEAKKESTGNTDTRDIITIGLLIQKSPKEEIFQTRVTKAGHYMPYTPSACLAIMNIPQATDLGDRRHGDFEYKNSQVQ